MINQKKYIGITIDFITRKKQHQYQKSNSLIHKAIVKYGIENFLFEIIKENLTVEEAEELEIQTIQNENTLAPNGYNLAKGGMHGGAGYKITDEDVIYIKSHRNQPMYVLYEQFSEKICYEYFKQIYNNQCRLDIVPTVPPYPNNIAFSCQFTKTNMSYLDIVNIRLAYANMEDWQTLYLKYKDKVAKSTFFDIYRGQQFQLVMPEVFSVENKNKHLSLSHGGEHNPKAKLKQQDVQQIRKLWEKEHKTLQEIHSNFPIVSLDTIRDIINYKTWKKL